MQALRECAEVALAAPSIFNTQPWCWQVHDDALRLWADRGRQLLVADPDGRMLTISCGVALHHARVALAAAGHEVLVRRLPEPGESDLLAEIRITGTRTPAAEDLRLREAIGLRRTDRRAFHEGLPAEAAAAVIEAVEPQGAHLHLVRPSEISTLALAAAQASAVQLDDRGYRRELTRWTHRPQWSSDGVPVTTAVEPGPRAVGVRNFVPFNERGMPAGPYADNDAQYMVIFTEQDSPLAWIQAGEALSAALLTVTCLGLASAPISDVTELAVTREQLRRLLAGIGIPQLAVRIGNAPSGPLPPVPRRPAREVIRP